MAIKRNRIEVTISELKTPAGNQHVEIRFAYPNGLKVHIFGANEAAARNALVEVMSSFHNCSKRGFTSIGCDSSPLLDDRDVSSIHLTD
jgi:hypothetical protein